MSLFSALNAAVSGLRAQSAQIAAVSENIANVSTTAYKTRGISFQYFVTGNSARVPSGGVAFDSYQSLREQGLIEATSTSTNLAINGNGFFVVGSDASQTGSELAFSRNGSFQTDRQGNLINTEGYLLYGWQTDTNGNISSVNANDLSGLAPINVQSITGSAQATTNVEIDANLPAEVPALSTFAFSFEIFDSLGVSHTVRADIVKGGANAWTMQLNRPVLTTNPTGGFSGDFAAAGDAAALPINFNGDGSLGADAATLATLATLSTIELDFSGAGPQSTGANNSTFNVNIGTAGLTDGLTQFASNSANPQIEIDAISQDGLRFGRLNEIQVDNSGTVFALFDSGLRQPIFRVPIATFSNPNGLVNLEGTVYDENQDAAGSVVLNAPGNSAAGDITASSLEQSTTDTSVEFNKMIVAQQGYSSSAQVISTADDLFDSLLRAVS